MQERVARRNNLDLKGQDFYGEVLDTLKHARIPILIGGGYALAWHTSIHRQTKDLDIFLRRKDCAPAFEVLGHAGFRTEIVFKHWLGKVRSGDDFIDIIFNSGNGLAEVTDAWFERAVDAEILGRAVQLCAPEEMIWSKAFVMERERFDGADITHLLRVTGASLDWPRLLQYFGEHWRVLLNHLILYDYIYPDEPSPLPARVMHDLFQRWEREKQGPRPGLRVCRGTLLSRAQYLVDIEEWGYADARRLPNGTMSAEEISTWTEAIPAELRRNSERTE